MLRREAGYFDTDSGLKPLLHLWSLGVEEQFYLTYPLLLWLIWRIRRLPLVVVLSLAVASFFLNVWQVRRDPAGGLLPATNARVGAYGGLLHCVLATNFE